jgi:hypothetical protein
MAYFSQFQAQSVPPWYEQALRTIIERSQVLGGEAYRPYRGPVIASTSPDLTRSFEMGRNTERYAPHFQQAGQLLGNSTQTFPHQYENYMNPYRREVMDNIAYYGNRNFNENILPALRDQFVGLGQHGSSRHADLALRAARDTQEGILRHQNDSLAQGYDQAARIFNADQARQMQGSAQAADLGRYTQGAHFADMAALQDQGLQQMNLRQRELDESRAEHYRVTGYPMDRWAQHASIVQGVPFQGAQSTNITQATPQPQPSVNTWGNVASLATSLLGARMASGRKAGGSVTRKSAPKSQKAFGLSSLKLKTIPSKTRMRPADMRMR